MEISGVRSELAIEQPRPSASAVPTASPSGVRTAPIGAFAQAISRLGRQIDVGEARAESASHLSSYDTGTLIALQVGIYRYTEAVDLASKIVDRATSALKTVLQGSGH